MYEVESAGFSIAVPGDWGTVSVDDVFSDDELDDFAPADPELAPFFDALKRPGSPLKFVAFKPTGDGITNVNVLTQVVPGMTRDEYFAVNLAEMRDVGPDIRHHTVRLPAGPALRMVIPASRDSGSASLQYLLFEEETAYIVTYTSGQAELAGLTPSFERSARSLTLLSR